MILTANNVVDPAKFLDRCRDGILQVLGLPHISLGWYAFLTGGLRKFFGGLSQAIESGLR